MEAAQEEEAAEETPAEEEEEETPEDGTLIDPQTGETVQMPDPESVDEEDDSVLGDTPVNQNLVDVQPEIATEENPDADPTE